MHLDNPNTFKMDIVPAAVSAPLWPLVGLHTESKMWVEICVLDTQADANRAMAQIISRNQINANHRVWVNFKEFSLFKIIAPGELMRDAWTI